MYSIIIKGTKNSGKSTTIHEVCRLLEPINVSELNIGEKQITHRDGNLDNGTYIIEVNSKNILVIAGAPTEQDATVTEIMEVCIKLKISIQFIISAMRSRELKPSFDTINELKKMSTLLLIEEIHRIDGDDFQESDEWINRISKISRIITNNL